MTKRDYDAHVYFTGETTASAQALNDRAKKELGHLPIFIGRLIHRPVGPHPLPMFEMDFGREYRDLVVDWLNAHRGGHTVLVHEVTGDDLRDHTEGASWLGDPMPLDLSHF